MKTKQKSQIIISICLIVVLFISGAFALFLADDSRVNRFESKTLSLNIYEEGWVDSDGDGKFEREDLSNRNMLSKQSIVKAPVIQRNKDDIDSFVFMSVLIPSTDAEYENQTKGAYRDSLIFKTAENLDIYQEISSFMAQTGTQITKYDLFNYSVNEDEGWVYLGADIAHRQDEDGYTTYYYGYNGDFTENTETNTLDTAPLFNVVTVANLTNQIDVDATSIKIQGFGIQKTGIEGETEEDKMFSAWGVIETEKEIKIA